jgi:hypothetical protein
VNDSGSRLALYLHYPDSGHLSKAAGVEDLSAEKIDRRAFALARRRD